MAEMATRIKPPYPMIGEVCQCITAAFDTKANDEPRRKELERLAREGDFDWSLRAKIINDLLIEPLKKYDPVLADCVENSVNIALDLHIKMVLKIPLDALSREEAAPLLEEFVYAAHLARFLRSIRERFGGPDLDGFLKSGVKPVDAIFDWAHDSLGLSVAASAFPNNKQERDEIGRWRRGNTVPSFSGAIRTLMRELRKHEPDREAAITLFGKWLLIARALAWLEREMGAERYNSFRSHVFRELTLNIPPRDVGLVLSTENNKAGRRLFEVMQCGLHLMHNMLRRTQPKQHGDQARCRTEIDRFRGIFDKTAGSERARYFLDWCEARWCVLSGQPDAALDHYERAANEALYRAGENQRGILQEAMALAAHLRKRPLLKRLKHRALAIGFFTAFPPQDQTASGVIQDWEIEQMAQAFPELFPAYARFPEASDSITPRALPLKIIDTGAADRIKPDLTNPDRVIGIPLLDGGKLRRPQLIWFASNGRADHVQRLLEADADVNKDDETGGSALLCALQHAIGHGNRQTLDLLLARPHKTETLNRLTERKRLSPLYLALSWGEPDVVATLLKMGAKADQPAGYPPRTPLDVCREKLALLSPEAVLQEFMRRAASPSLEDGESLRRHTGGLSGVFGDSQPMPNLENPRHVAILKSLSGYYAATPPSREKLLRIQDLLLGAGVVRDTDG